MLYNIILGDKSLVTDIDNPGPEFPLFPINDRLTVDLQTADVLYIPALWFHNMKVQICVMVVSEIRLIIKIARNQQIN